MALDALLTHCQLAEACVADGTADRRIRVDIDLESRLFLLDGARFIATLTTIKLPSSYLITTASTVLSATSRIIRVPVC